MSNHRRLAPSELLPEPVFVVLRAAPGVPFGWMAADLEGRWCYRKDLLTLRGPVIQPVPHAVAIPTDRLEHREDGATAQVWEVHPIGGNYANYANDGDEGDWKP